MIRFIDLRGQITADREPHFAFFDTVRDRFLDINSEQDWHSIEDFMEAFEISPTREHVFRERCISLIPRDYFQPKSICCNAAVDKLASLPLCVRCNGQLIRVTNCTYAPLPGRHKAGHNDRCGLK